MNRITNQWIINSFLRTINKNYTNLSKTQIQISSGKQIQLPSDNPVNSSLILARRTELFEGYQYIKNISRTTEWLDNTDSALTQLETALQRARELAVQGANDTLTQVDRDAIAKEIEQLIDHILNIANTNVAGEFIFAGTNTKTKPFEKLYGKDSNFMRSVVSYSTGEIRKDINLSNILDVIYSGNNIKTKIEIEKGATITRNVTGLELFFANTTTSSTPKFDYLTPPLYENLPLDILNNGKGVQKGLIILTDGRGIQHKIDLTSVHRLEDVIYQINKSELFEAGIEQIPSNTALNLGIYKNVGQNNIIIGLSDPAMDSENVPLSSLNNGMGVELGYISINTRDGKNYRVDISNAKTIKDVINLINQIGGGGIVEAKYDQIHRRLEIIDKTGGKGEFSIQSYRNQLYIKELPARTARDLGIYKDVWVDDTIVSNFDPAVVDQETPLSLLNKGRGVAPGYISISGRDGKSIIVDLREAKTISDVINAINIQTNGRQYAYFDNATKRLVIKDNTAPISGAHFKIEEVDGLKNTAKDLGIWQDAGVTNTIYGISDPQMASLNTPLSSLNGGRGVYLGIINIKGRDGINTKVDLSNANTIEDVINIINNTTNGRQIASFDSVNKRLVIIDNTTPKQFETFTITAIAGKETITIRENSTVAKRLGILGSTVGSTLVGETILPPNLTISSNLSDIIPPPDLGSIVIKGPDEKPLVIDLSSAKTIQDVINKINQTEAYNATFDEINSRFVIKSNLAINGITIEEQTNTARDLGFILGATTIVKENKIVSRPIIIDSMPTLIGGVDLDPALELDTELSSLNTSRIGNTGVNLGRIRITDRAGNFATIDLRGCKTIADVLNKINDPANGLYIEAKINETRNGIDIIDKNRGAFGRLEVIDIDSTTAVDLGINGWTLDNTLYGKDLDPGLTTTTKISSLRINEGGIKLGKIFVQSGEFSGEIDLSNVTTVGDLLDKISTSDSRFNIVAWINADKKRINISNTKNQPYIKVQEIEIGDSNIASGLGLAATRGIFRNLIDLRDNLLRNDSYAITNQSLKFIQEDIERVLKFHAEVGVKTNRANLTKEKLENFNLNINKLLDSVENIDIAEAITKLTNLETAFRAALQSGARIMQITLLDFLK